MQGSSQFSFTSHPSSIITSNNQPEYNFMHSNKQQYRPTPISQSRATRSNYPSNQQSQINISQINKFQFTTTQYTAKHLQKYRIKKQSQKTTQQSQSFLPQIICQLLNMNKQKSDLSQTKSAVNLFAKCSCNRTQQNLCEFIMLGIEEHYYWKTDRQFNRIYQHYSKYESIKIICIKFQKFLDFRSHQNQAVLQILANYYKHAIYYQKYDKLIKQSNVYIWVCLGIMHHINLSQQNINYQQNKVIAFWALDIAMDTIGQVTSQIFAKCSRKAYKNFHAYFTNFMTFVYQKGVNMNQIIYQWAQQMMFGYMGIQSILFFIDCFKKAGWNYFIKVMLSYLEYRINQIKKQADFKNRTIDRQNLIKLIVNSKQQWPMIFCSASSFKISQ